MGFGQSLFKKNHSTVGFKPIPIQEEAVNHGVRPSPFKKNLLIGFGQSPFKKNHSKIGFGQSPFKKNHSKVGFGPIPVLEESLNNGVRAVPPSRRIAQEDNSLGWH